MYYKIWKNGGYLQVKVVSVSVTYTIANYVIDFNNYLWYIVKKFTKKD